MTSNLKQRLLAQADDKQHLSFADFMHIVLYDPDHGYYRAERQRVGRSSDTDFYTAQSLGPVFQRLLLNAVNTLIEGDLSRYTWVEIGREPGNPWWLEGQHPFGALKSIGAGDPVKITGPSIVFSNELFDAQAFHRLVYHQGAWRELGVDLNGDAPTEVILPRLSDELAPALQRLPKDHTEGYVLDLPLRAEQLLHRICTEPWQGLFIAFDYGRSWDQLLFEYPHGTARAYHRHEQSNDLLALPGQQDLTCHINWDGLNEVLKSHGFSEPQLENQEAFFMHHAQQAIGDIITAKAGQFDPARQTLMHLLHPGNMGLKFQVLSARR